MSFQQLQQLVRDGEAVSAGTVNRPTRVLDQNITYLKALIDAAGIGSTIVANDQTVESATKVGMPVFFNPATQRFERGLVAVNTSSSGVLEVAESTRIWGVVQFKTNATKANILLHGFTTLDITEALDADETLSAGLYYLSRVTAGKLIKARPPVAVPVLHADGNGQVFVNPRWEDVLTSHTHVHVVLKPQPAGLHSDPGAGNVHTITSPEYTVEGWLAADDAIFDGKAPSGAKFGYNLGANVSLKAMWPPMPAGEAVLVLDGSQVPTGETGQVIIDKYGIWWLSDCYGDVPFPDEISTDSLTLSQASESPDLNPCYDYKMTLDLYFTRFGFLTDQTVVTSIVSDDPRLLVYCAGDPTRPATVGAVALSLDLGFLLGTTTETGYLALKTFDAETQVFNRGPVASGIYAASSNVVLTGEHMTTRIVDSAGRDIYHGAVGVDIDTGLDRELQVQLVRLNGVDEAYIEDVMYLSFPADELTNFRARIHVPETLDIASPKLRFKLRILGRGNGTMPDLTLNYRVIPKPAVLGVPEALPTVDTAGVITTAVAVTTNTYFDVESDPIDVTPGCDVLFTLERDGADVGDTYSYEIGVLRQAGVVAAA